MGWLISDEDLDEIVEISYEMAQYIGLIKSPLQRMRERHDLSINPDALFPHTTWTPQEQVERDYRRCIDERDAETSGEPEYLVRTTRRKIYELIEAQHDD